MYLNNAKKVKFSNATLSLTILLTFTFFHISKLRTPSCGFNPKKRFCSCFFSSLVGSSWIGTSDPGFYRVLRIFFDRFGSKSGRLGVQGRRSAWILAQLRTPSFLVRPSLGSCLHYSHTDSQKSTWGRFLFVRSADQGWMKPSGRVCHAASKISSPCAAELLIRKEHSRGGPASLSGKWARRRRKVECSKEYEEKVGRASVRRSGIGNVGGVLKKSLAWGWQWTDHYGDAVAEAVRVCVCGFSPCRCFLRSGTTILCVPIRCRRIHISCKVCYRCLVFLSDRRRPYWPRNQPFRARLEFSGQFRLLPLFASSYSSPLSLRSVFGFLLLPSNTSYWHAILIQ